MAVPALWLPKTQLTYDIPGLEPMETTGVSGLPEVRPGQTIPLSNAEWFDWVPKVVNHRIQMAKETRESWSGQKQARARECARVAADERYLFYTYFAIYEARSESEQINVTYASEREEKAARGPGRAGFRPYILYPFQDYWIVWQRRAFLTRGPLGDTITLKSRDMGMSNTAVGMLAARWLTMPNYHARLMSRVEPLVDNTADPDSLFWKVDGMLRGSPRWMIEEFKPGFNWEKHRRHMMLEDPFSKSLLAGESTNSTAGRGKRADAALCDEFPFMLNFKTIWDNLRAATYHRMALGSASTQKGMDAYNLVRSERHALILIDSRTGMHPKQTKEWHELERSRGDQASYDQEIGMDWFADYGDFVYPAFMRKDVTEAPYLPYQGPVYGAVDDGAHWAMWVLQHIIVTGRIHVLACYRNHGKPTRFYGAMMRGFYLAEFEYDEFDRAAVDFFKVVQPNVWMGDSHAANWEQNSGTSVIEDLQRGFGITLNVDFQRRKYKDRHDDLEDVIPRLDFNASWPWMREGLNALQMYKYPSTPEGKELRREPTEPLHNDDSHYATALEWWAGLFPSFKDHLFAQSGFQWTGEPGW
jgi:hypothetical protein